MYKVFIALSALILFTACAKEKPASTVTETQVTFTKEGTLRILKSDGTLVKTLEVEFADDEYERQTGLMNRGSMEATQSMLFVFPDEQPRAFYMKNTLIPLDIIYIGSNKKIVSFAENAKPRDEASLPSQVPAQYVLEIKGGLSEVWGLDVGDTVTWEED